MRSVQQNHGANSYSPNQTRFSTVGHALRLALLIVCFDGLIGLSVGHSQTTEALNPLKGSHENKKIHSPFGVASSHTNNHREAYDLWLPAMKSIGVKELRTPQTSWTGLESTPNQWDWSRLDSQLEYLDNHGFNYQAMLIGYPEWKRDDGGWGLPVNHLPAWSNYVRQLATKLQGRTWLLEVWNEPPNFTKSGQTPADYAKIVMAAAKAAKTVDSRFQIGLAAKSNHLIFLEQTIRAGAKDHFDYITLHPYEILDSVAVNKGTEAVFMNIVPSVRKMLRECNPERQTVPIYFTELGVDSSLGLDVQASALIKAYVMSMAQGVAGVYWFEGRDGDSGPLGLLDREGKPRLAYQALGSLIKHLTNHPEYVGWIRLKGIHHGFVFRANSNSVLIAWAASGRDETVVLDQPVTIIDPLSGLESNSEQLQLKSAPVFALNLPKHLVAEAAANREKPYLWDVDRSQDVQVSIEFGDQTTSNGLHTLAGDQVARAVEAYGGFAREGGIPGGNCFVVDPSFLSWDAVPIEVSVEVRRTATRENAGFKFIYEGGADFECADGWHTIPDNDQWNTFTWRIDAPRFVNYWGFNFRLESDGRQYSKYLIKKVTVKKIAHQTQPPKLP